MGNGQLDLRTGTELAPDRQPPPARSERSWMPGKPWCRHARAPALTSSDRYRLSDAYVGSGFPPMFVPLLLDAHNDAYHCGRFIDISPLPPNQEVMQPKRQALAKRRQSNLSSVDENR